MDESTRAFLAVKITDDKPVKYHVSGEALERYYTWSKLNLTKEELLFNQLALGSNWEDDPCTHEELIQNWKGQVERVKIEFPDAKDTITMFQDIVELLEKGMQPLIDMGIFTIQAQ